MAYERSDLSGHIRLGSVGYHVGRAGTITSSSRPTAWLSSILLFVNKPTASGASLYSSPSHGGPYRIMYRNSGGL